MTRFLAIPLARIPFRQALLIAGSLVVAAVLAMIASPKLTTVENVPNLEDSVPRSFGDWRERPSPIVQVSLTTGTEPDMNQPYDQTVMRAYQNSQGQIVYLALAWGEQQRQEVKIHRPDLCYVAQGFKVWRLESVAFDQIATNRSTPVSGKHMLAFSGQVGEAVSYWMRIGGLFSEDAFETRIHILREGLQGRIPDGVLVRASAHVRDEKEAEAVWPVLDEFMRELTEASPEAVRGLMLGQVR
ncbi:MAG TPA: EpsI family protein [Rhodocyclaceae bacterium]|nr:EpsI family protein [Rhodocyclaceae bacterium]